MSAAIPRSTPMHDEDYLLASVPSSKSQFHEDYMLASIPSSKSHFQVIMTTLIVVNIYKQAAGCQDANKKSPKILNSKVPEI